MKGIKEKSNAPQEMGWHWNGGMKADDAELQASLKKYTNSRLVNIYISIARWKCGP